MSDFIRRKDAVELLKNDIENNGLPLDDEYNIGIDHAMCLLACVPTAEPKVGHWIMHIDDLFPADSTQECSICHEHQYLMNDDKYCPNCGAKMERSE